MSTGDEELERVLAPLRDGPVPLDGEPQLRSRRERVLPALREQTQGLPMRRLRLERTRTLRMLGMTASGLALAAAAVIGLRSVPEERQARAIPAAASAATEAGATVATLHVESATPAQSSFIDASGASRPLHRGALPISDVSELRSKDDGTAVRTSEGAAVLLAPHSRLGVKNEHGRARLRLLQGEVSCSVPKLGPDASFGLDTPDARVVVHGTRFSVRVSDRPSARTCVRVQEGLVAVHHGEGRTMLGAGQQYGCDARPVTAERAPRDFSAQPRTARKQAGEAAELGTLEEENRLLEKALSAERASERARARELFGQLLSRYPNSPLAADAASGLARTR